jgi:hypothetical protein
MWQEGAGDLHLCIPVGDAVLFCAVVEPPTSHAARAYTHSSLLQQCLNLWYVTWLLHTDEPDKLGGPQPPHAVASTRTTFLGLARVIIDRMASEVVCRQPWATPVQCVVLNTGQRCSMTALVPCCPLSAVKRLVVQTSSLGVKMGPWRSGMWTGWAHLSWWSPPSCLSQLPLSVGGISLILQARTSWCTHSLARCAQAHTHSHRCDVQ